MDKATRKAAFKTLLYGSGLTVDSAPAVLGTSRVMVAAYLRDIKNDTTAGPSDEILEALREIVVRRAKNILEEGWVDEARNPLGKDEFLRQIAKRLDDLINIEDEHRGERAATYKLDIVGRTGLLERIKVPRNGRELPEMREEILSTAWDHYRRQTNRSLKALSPEQERQHRKDRLRDLRDDLKLKNREIAEATGWSVGSVNAWLEPGKSNMPPEWVIEELKKHRQKWAFDVLVAAEADRALALSQGKYALPNQGEVTASLGRVRKSLAAA